MSWNPLKNRFQDTIHAIFRKVHSLERDIAVKAGNYNVKEKDACELARAL
jgi:hypothetical protein